jgi:hypothetical protein
MSTDGELRIRALYNSTLARIDLGDLDAAARATLRPSFRAPCPIRCYSLRWIMEK